MAPGVSIVEIGHDGQLTLFHVRAFEDTIEMRREKLARLVLADSQLFIYTEQVPVGGIVLARPTLRQEI